MRVIFCTDSHFGLSIGGYDFFDDTLKAFRSVIDATHGMDLFVFGGDLFHTGKPGPRENAAVIDLLDECSCPVIMLVGNHDVGKRSEPHALEPLKKIRFYQHVKVVDEPIVISIDGSKFAFCPYTNDVVARKRSDVKAQDEVDELFDEAGRTKNMKALFSHLDVEGADLGGGAFLRGGQLKMPLKVAKKFPFPVINGHIHKQQLMSENIVNPGSIGPMNFSDVNLKKGYIELEV